MGVGRVSSTTQQHIVRQKNPDKSNIVLFIPDQINIPPGVHCSSQILHKVPFWKHYVENRVFCLACFAIDLHLLHQITPTITYLASKYKQGWLSNRTGRFFSAYFSLRIHRAGIGWTPNFVVAKCVMNCSSFATLFRQRVTFGFQISPSDNQ